MRSRLLYILPVIIGAICAPAYANWQYPGTYVGDGWYTDDGGRFVLSARGGASYSMAKIKNEIGTMASEYYYDPTNDLVVSVPYYDACVAQGGCGEFVYAGIGDIASLPPHKDYSAVSFAAGASLGWTLPNHPQWRIEAGWDHISETEYNQSPLFDGDIELVGGDQAGLSINVQSGGVQSNISTDIISIMAFYDFFDGVQKPTGKFIPYIGIGAGYADSKTKLNLTDLYGDLSTSAELQQFGEVVQYKDENGNLISVTRFYPSETRKSNIAGILALGVSYGLNQNMFIDFGARVTYLPGIKWALTGEDDTRHRDWFGAENLIYANVMLGLRFEF